MDNLLYFLRLLLSCDTNQITYSLCFFIVIVDFFFTFNHSSEKILV
jgi:hypothetical protein